MDKFAESDYDNFADNLRKSNVIRLADVADRVEKVAFDVVRFKESDGLDQLWKIEETQDGPVLVAMYGDSEEQLESHGGEGTNWKAISDKEANVNVFYKDEPITKIAVSQLGIPKEEAGMVCRYLPEKLANDKEFATSLLDTLTSKEREVLVSKYPELA